MHAAVNYEDRRILQSTVNSVHESILLLLWVGLTVELYNKGKNMQILLQKYFHPIVAAAMARLGHRALS